MTDIKKPKTFFTADLHFGDTNWGKGFKKQTGSQEEKEAKLALDWNRTVHPEDTVYVLGDFAETIEDFLTFHSVLNGTKVYLLGNHDPKRLKEDRHFRKWLFPNVQFFEGEGHRVTIDKQVYFLSHRPFASWPWDAIHVHGHLHGGKSYHWNEDYKEMEGRVDVGVECWDGAPVDENTVYMENNPWKAWNLNTVTYVDTKTGTSKEFEYYAWGDTGYYGSHSYDLSKDLDWRPKDEINTSKKNRKKYRGKHSHSRSKRWYW